MKILIAHCAYQHKGGEDTVVDSEIDLLKEHGHEVQVYLRQNQDIKSVSPINAAMQALWSKKTFNELSKLLDQFEPDVIHAHNTFPLISPSIYWIAHKKKIPVIQTIHNFRLLCPQAMFLRDGKVCEDCLGHFPLKGILYKCYRDSYAQSAVSATMLGIHRMAGTYSNKVTRYIACNDFFKQKFIEAGFRDEQIVVKPNFVADPGYDTSDIPKNGGLFVGRLSPEKGLDTLIKAQSMNQDLPVSVIGSGPMTEAVKQASGMSYLGFWPLDKIYEVMKSSAWLALPSIWYENFPRTLVEAYACGLPVIGSRIGSLTGLIDEGVTGLLFNPQDDKDLGNKIAWANTHPDEMRKMGAKARLVYEQKYTSKVNYDLLIAIYNDAITSTRQLKL